MASSPIVGVWRVRAEGAPFPYHMFAFHSDGILHQSNPPAGNTTTSDTAGLGVWEDRGGAVKARLEEYRLACHDHSITRGVIELTLSVSHNSFTGTAEFNVYDVDDKHLDGPLYATVEGQKVTLV
ncbi:hypothetical protein GA0074694_4142 [Micromonospora inyonensis]|uniref:META domain-containing protein n=2 Tax=Micromonospora inyonensis TaxID=47866 RepID=A0A1C6S6P2_9ACTN|nr:hypothetical protein GA0074694_4142 [Micromonospora inyonensis]